METKRELLANDIQEALKEIENGDFMTGDFNDVMKAIDVEVKSNK